MYYLFEKEKLEKVFDTLANLGRGCEDRYLGWSELNPHIAYCERSVYVSRIRNIILPSRYIKVFNIENKTISYIYVNYIDYHLGYSNEFNVYYIDYANLNLGVQSKILGWNDLNRLEGVFCEDSSEHQKVIDLLKLNLPVKTFRFEAIDFNKYPKRLKKGEKVEDKIRTFVDITAITIEDALNKRKDHAKDGLFILENFEII